MLAYPHSRFLGFAILWRLTTMAVLERSWLECFLYFKGDTTNRVEVFVFSGPWQEVNQNSREAYQNSSKVKHKALASLVDRSEDPEMSIASG